MLLERSMHPEWMSNTYLLADPKSSEAALVDAGGPVAPLLEVISREGLTLTQVLVTHRHFDHIAELETVVQAYPEVKILAHPLEQQFISEKAEAIGPGEVLFVGDLSIEAMHTPGHTNGMLSFYVGGSGVFTGDTLFRESVGGLGASGHTTFTDLKDSIMKRLMKLPPETTIYPGHTEFTTVAHEYEHNPFIRLWRGLDQPDEKPCRVLEQPATLILLATDYDGGKKAWIQWEDGSDDIVPGSAVQL